MRFTEVLDNDWNHRPPTRHRLGQWAATNNSLDQPVATICIAVTSWTRSTSDAVVQPLMALAAGGDEDACRLLVIALARRLLPLANRRQNSGCQEAFDDLVGYLTEAIISPHPAWTRAFADQLVRTAERRWLAARQTRELVHDPDQLTRTCGTIDHSFALVEQRLDVINSLNQLQRSGVLSPVVAVTLARVAIIDEQFAAIERERPCSPAAAKKARQRELATVRGR